MKLFSIFRAPSIIVMDDIDSMFANRDKTQNEALRRLVSTLLTLMDGIVSVGLVEQKNKITTIFTAFVTTGQCIQDATYNLLPVIILQK